MEINLRFWLVLFLALAISFVPIFYFLNGQAIHLISEISPLLLLGLTCLMLFSWLAEGLRLHFICAGVGLRIPLRSALPLVMSAEFAGAATPAASGMGAAYLVFLHRRGLNIGTAAAVLLAIAITDLLFMISIFLFSLFYLALFDNRLPDVRVIFWLALISFVTAVLLFVIWHFERRRIVRSINKHFLRFSWYQRYRSRIALFFSRFFRALELLREISWRQRAIIFLSAAGYWTPRYLVLWALMRYVGGQISVPYIIVSQTLLNLTSQLSFLPGGAGSVGAAYGLLFGGSLPQADIAFSLLGWRLFTYYWYLFVGMPWFFYEWGCGKDHPGKRQHTT
ncbi:YbhN family protein [Acidithiobacillus sp. IBUN Pt1247-S3]|uniref:lysylphosphatidylglycerol synthase transmembrane domain-containing protein n=1 Tax=Acidithiobacillus sp. IBUN Pt1247-S3 TaxID=3166642 RepID=UPI0034E448BC